MKLGQGVTLFKEQTLVRVLHVDLNMHFLYFTFKYSYNFNIFIKHTAFGNVVNTLYRHVTGNEGRS